MTFLNRLRGAALIALALILLSPALAFGTSTDLNASEPNQYAEIAVTLSLLGLIGAVTVTYKYQLKSTTVLTSSTVAPTAIQAQDFNSLAAVVEMAQEDTTAPITHNWAVPANERSKYQPWANLNMLTAGTAAAVITWDFSNTNSVVFNKTAADGSSGTWVVTLQRPNTIVT